MSMELKGVVISYRRGPGTQRSRECLIKFPNVKSRFEASKLIGRKIVWSDGKSSTIAGVILSPHGKKGIVRARFRKGLPGQALGSLVRIIG
jgi:large subunit ribosomal protein L35Ae